MERIEKFMYSTGQGKVPRGTMQRELYDDLFPDGVKAPRMWKASGRADWQRDDASTFTISTNRIDREINLDLFLTTGKGPAFVESLYYRVSECPQTGQPQVDLELAYYLDAMNPEPEMFKATYSLDLQVQCSWSNTWIGVEDALPLPNGAVVHSAAFEAAMHDKVDAVAVRVSDLGGMGQVTDDGELWVYAATEYTQTEVLDYHQKVHSYLQMEANGREGKPPVSGPAPFCKTPHGVSRTDRFIFIRSKRFENGMLPGYALVEVLNNTAKEMRAAFAMRENL